MAGKRATENRGINSRFGIIIMAGALLLAVSCQNHRANRQLEYGKKLHQEGAFLEAIRNWENILSSWPQSRCAAQALHRIGTTYYVELDQPERALDAFARLVKNYPDSSYAPADQILVAEIYRSRRQFAQALAEYYRFLQLFPGDSRASEVWYNLVTCLFEVGEYQAMRTQAEELRKKFPDTEYAGDCIFWVGESYYLEKNYQPAIAMFQEYLKKFPNGPMAYKSWLSLARSLEGEDQLKEAIQLYQELQNRYPDDKVIRSRLASASKRYQDRFGTDKPSP